MRQLLGTEIFTGELPRQIAEPTVAIERPAEGVSITWHFWDIGRITAPSYHGTPNEFDLGDVDAAEDLNACA
jgi:hypothetical protein